MRGLVCLQFDAQRSRVVPFPLPDAPAAESSSSTSALPALPAALTHEPSEIAHVWVVSQLSGSTSVNLRAASGKFLACDRFGVVTADSESRGPLESFNVHVLGGGSGSIALETTCVHFKTGTSATEQADARLLFPFAAGTAPTSRSLPPPPLARRSEVTRPRSASQRHSTPRSSARSGLRPGLLRARPRRRAAGGRAKRTSMRSS